VSLPALAFVPLVGDASAALARVPAAPGVGQILGPEGRSLLVAVAPNLRRWAGSHLGLGKTAAPGRRPRTNLAPVAAAVGWVEADGAFRQRLLYERLVAPLVPPSARRDLKPPAFLHLDPSARFPRVSVLVRGAEGGPVFGPFRDRRAAEKARDALHRLFPLRPCEYVFEPDPALPLGLGCLYAQVRSCAAPCLARVGETEYQALAARAAAWLSDPSARPDAPAAVSPLVSAANEARAVVVDAGRREVSLYPVRGGRVLDAEAVTAAPDAIEAAVARLSWPRADGPDDWPWLGGWLRRPRGRASWVAPCGEDRAALAAAVRAALPPRFAAPGRGDNVGATREEA
jgi:hypothetical protein